MFQLKLKHDSLTFQCIIIKLYLVLLQHFEELLMALLCY